MALSLVQASVVGLTASTPGTSASFTWDAGDLFIVAGVTAHSSGGWTAPTATGLTFSTIDTASTGGWGWGRSWEATAAGSGSGTISIPGPSGAFYGAVCYQFRGHDGVGVHGAGSGGSTRTISLATTAGSAVVYLAMDESVSTPGYTLTPGSSPTPTERADGTATNISWHGGDWVGVGAATTSYGTSGSGGNWFRVAVEVLEDAGGGTPHSVSPVDPVGVTDLVVSSSVTIEHSYNVRVG